MYSGTLKSVSEASEFHQDNDSLKFQLFARTLEMKQISESLTQVAVMPQTAREKWAAEHEESITHLLDTFMDDASNALDGLYLDPEAMKLSMEFMSILKDAMNKLQSILYNDTEIVV